MSAPVQPRHNALRQCAAFTDSRAVWMLMSGLKKKKPTDIYFGDNAARVACEKMVLLHLCCKLEGGGVFSGPQRQYLGRVGEDVALLFNGNAW